MGICWCSQAPKENQTTTPSSTAQISSAISQTTSNTTSTTVSSSLSTITQFSARSGDESNPQGQILPASDLRNFTFAELRAATKNFRGDNLLGEGGFGRVYKGLLDDKFSNGGTGTVVAVKKLNSESLQGVEEWQSEVNFLGRLSHRNLVKLLGFCWEDGELLLVYEFMQKGSLENHIFGRGQPLWWDIRIKIAVGAAQGLAFLHTSNQVIYRDFKASNILLDASYNAKISDFGLAKVGPSASKSHLTTRVMGTAGYAAPEYLATGHLYVKSDVYGFGVVLVEMLTGLRAVDTNRCSGRHTLVDWIKPYLQDRRKLKIVMDSRLEARYPPRAAFQTAKLALTCLETEPKNRPSMIQVLDTLEQIQSTTEKPKEPRTTTRPPTQPHPLPSPYVHNRQLPARRPMQARHNMGQVYQHSPRHGS